jgi:hypothetical protein
VFALCRAGRTAQAAHAFAADPGRAVRPRRDEPADPLAAQLPPRGAVTFNHFAYSEPPFPAEKLIAAFHVNIFPNLQIFLF